MDARLAALEKARRAPRLKPAEFLDPKQKHAKKPTRKSAVDAKCYECEGEDADPCYKWRIGNCVIDTCPLWCFRPFRSYAGRPIPQSLRSE